MKAVVFDLDGTLVDSHPAIVACFRASVASAGLPPVHDHDVIGRIGLPLLTVFDEVLADAPHRAREEALACFRASYVDFDRRFTRPFPGVLELVARLRADGLPTAICTAKSRIGLDRTAEEHGLVALFDVLLATDDVARPKPHPDMVLDACGQLGVAPSEVVVVGDSAFDVQMGVSAGATAIGVSWGAHDAARLRAAGAAHVVDTVGELEARLGR